MTIKKLTQQEYDELLVIQQTHEKLTFHNDGYQYLKMDELNEEETKAFHRAANIVSTHIIGFIEFNHFRRTKNEKEGDLGIRFQYNYGAEDDSMSFTGVGYILLDELLNGFKS
jgi:hypothetical protein